MSLMDELDQRFTAAMKGRDQRTLDLLRMVRTRLREHVRTHRTSGEVPDAEVAEVIAAYVKQLEKSLPEFAKGGEAGAAAMAQIRFEIDYLRPFLPQLLDEAATRAIVERVVTELGRPPLGRSGMVIGQIMKEHKGRVDPALVRRLVEAALAP